MFITGQGPRLRNDLYCVEWDVKLYYTIPYRSYRLREVYNQDVAVRKSQNATRWCRSTTVMGAVDGATDGRPWRTTTAAVKRVACPLMRCIV